MDLRLRKNRESPAKIILNGNNAPRDKVVTSNVVRSSAAVVRSCAAPSASDARKLFRRRRRGLRVMNGNRDGSSGWSGLIIGKLTRAYKYIHTTRDIIYVSAATAAAGLGQNDRSKRLTSARPPRYELLAAPSRLSTSYAQYDILSSCTTTCL